MWQGPPIGGSRRRYNRSFKKKLPFVGHMAMGECRAPGQQKTKVLCKTNIEMPCISSRNALMPRPVTSCNAVPYNLM